MSMCGRQVHAVTALCIAAVTLIGGCTSTGSGEKNLESFSRTRANLAAAQDDVDHTLATMNGLRITTATNLGNAFKQYKDAVTRLERRGVEATRLADATKENMDMNVITWQKELESIQDPTIKASAQSRRDAVRSNYAQLQMYAQDARKAYDAFMKDNQDIIKALSMDLSPAGISSLAPAMDRAAADGKTLKQKIAAAQRAMDNMANGQPPIGSSQALLYDPFSQLNVRGASLNGSV
jgi:hypothetical protein